MIGWGKAPLALQRVTIAAFPGCGRFSMRHFVITFIGPDRTGVVEDIALEVGRLGGNWLESRLGRLEGKFAGLISVALPDGVTSALSDALALIVGGPWLIQIEPCGDPIHPGPANFQVTLVGPDRPGIVGEISGALAGIEVSIVTMDTLVEGAPFSGELLFKADIEVLAPEGMDSTSLRQCLEPVADEMTLDLDIENR